MSEVMQESRFRAAPLFSICSQVRQPNVGGREQNLLSLSYGRIVAKDINSSDGLLPANFDGYNIIEPGDTVLRLTDLQNDQRSLRTGIVRERGIITSAYLSLRPNQLAVEPRFLAYSLHALDVTRVFYGLGGGLRQSIGFDDIKSLRVPLPGLEEQARIADFLDDQTARVDQAILSRRRQTALLRAELASLIEELLFAGSETGVSPAAWAFSHLAVAPELHGVPDGWRSKRFKSVLKAHFEVRGERLMPMLSLSSRGYLYERQGAADRQQASQGTVERNLVVRPGDLVVNPMWLTGGAIAVSQLGGTVSPDYRVFLLSSGLAPRFVHHLVRSRPYLHQYVLYTRATTTFDRRVRQEDLDQMPLRLPPLSTQRSIATQIDLLEESSTAVEGAHEQSMALLQEFKRSLVSAAVSGEFDVLAASERGVPL